MNEKVIRALVEAGAVRQVRIIANQSSFHVRIETANCSNVAETLKGKLKTWTTLNAAAKWIRSLGIGEAKLELTHWNPDQKAMSL